MNTKIRRIMSREEMENHADVFHCSKRARERSNCFDETYDTDIEPLTFDSLKPVTILNNGAQATIRHYHHDASNTSVVIKEFSVKHRSACAHERASLTIIQSNSVPHTIELVDMAIPTSRPMIALKHYKHGSIFDWIAKVQAEKGDNSALPSGLVKRMILQILTALAQIHDLGIAHFDIKPDNILVDDDFNAVLADFGLAQMMSSDSDTGLYNKAGTASYTAPELLSKQPNGVPHSKALCDPRAVDVWSLSCTAFALLFGSVPFADGCSPGSWYHHKLLLNDRKAFWANHQLYRTDSEMPIDSKNFFDKVFTLNPAERPTVHDLLQDPWLNADVMSAEESQQFFQQLELSGI